MKKHVLHMIVAFLMHTACRTSNSSIIEYSTPVDQIIQVIKNEINTEQFISLNIKIDNCHNGCFHINTTIKNTENGFLLLTNTLSNTEIASDTTILLTQAEINAALLELEKGSKLILAGNYQDVTIEYRTSKEIFYTRQAHGLMRFLERGKTN